MKQIELGGVQAHLTSFYNIWSNSDLNFSMLNEIKAIKNIIVDKKTQLNNFRSKKQLIKSHITLNEMQNYESVKIKKIGNQQIIKVLVIADKLTVLSNKWVNQSVSLQQRMNNFKELCQSINEFETQIGIFSQKVSENYPNQAKLNNQKMNQIRNNFYKRVKVNLQKKDKQYQNKVNEVKILLTQLQLPLRKNHEKGKPPTIGESNLIIDFLHHEACSFYLYHVVENLTNEVYVKNTKRKSYFFNVYWQKIIKAIHYHFLVHGQNHDVEEPTWLFQYQQETFNMNFRYFVENIFTNNYPQTIINQVHNYIVSYNFKEFFFEIILQRLQIDLPSFTPFTAFNFLDEVYQFQQKLSITFQSQIDFIEDLLIKNRKMLSINFVHEHQWIQSKIFTDFYNINYSNVNLKNLQAYNVTVNYIALFQRLYSKFRKITDVSLIQQIQAFYQKSIINLVAHIKTSFERIYYHSGYSKLQIIGAYKRVEKEFRTYFGGLLSQIPSFEQKIQQDYYNHLSQSLQVFGLEELSPIHRKIIKKVTEMTNKYFVNKQIEKSKERDEKLSEINKIYQEWSQKIQQFSQIQPFVDEKLKSILFVYIQEIKFSQPGFQLFKEIFTPFFVEFYTHQGLRILIMLLQMEPNTRSDYIQHPNTQIHFLSAKQLRSIQKIKIT